MRGLLLALLLLPLGACDTDFEPAGERFIALDIYVDAGEETLAAWQVEFSSKTTTLVGVEGGDAPFDRAPSYDPQALHAEGKIILAAFCKTQKTKGRIRVARLHALERGPELVVYTTENIRAARRDGKRIDVKIQVRRAKKDR